MHVQARSGHGYIIVKTERAYVDDCEGLVITAEICFPRDPRVYVHRDRAFESHDILAEVNAFVPAFKYDKPPETSGAAHFARNRRSNRG